MVIIMSLGRALLGRCYTIESKLVCVRDETDLEEETRYIVGIFLMTCLIFMITVMCCDAYRYTRT